MIQNVDTSTAFPAFKGVGKSQHFKSAEPAEIQTTSNTPSNDTVVSLPVGSSPNLDSQTMTTLLDTQEEDGFKSNGRFDDSLRFNGTQGRGLAFGKVKHAEEPAPSETPDGTTEVPGDDTTGNVDDTLETAPEETSDETATAPTPEVDDTVSDQLADAQAALDILTASSSENEASTLTVADILGGEVNDTETTVDELQ